MIQSSSPLGGAVVATSCPAVAGFRPAGAALALAAVFAAAAGGVHAQTQVPGQTGVTQGGTLTAIGVTQIGTLTPVPTLTQIVVTPSGNLTLISGTLTVSKVHIESNAVVDMHLIASTLRMAASGPSAGQLAFGQGGSGALKVAGQVLARGGDVVLVAPDDVQVAPEALVSAPNGAVMLAAGRKVTVTGRGLEGIQLEVRAPGDQAVDLGRLESDAVGIFAGRLRHSGMIQAAGVSAEGGRVVLSRRP